MQNTLITLVASLLLGQSSIGQPLTPRAFDCSVWNDSAEARALVEPYLLKEPMIEMLRQICTKGRVMFALVEEDKSIERVVRAVIKNDRTGKISFEKVSHPTDTTCEILPISNGTQLNYLCYNSLAGSGQTTGHEYSYRPRKDQTYERACTIHFSGDRKKKCGPWQLPNKESSEGGLSLPMIRLQAK